MKHVKASYLAALLSIGLFTAVGTAGEGQHRHGHTGSIGESPIEREINPELPTVVFYKLPRCGICTQIDSWLVKLDADNQGVANYVRKNSTDETLLPEMKSRGIEHHGVVFLDQEDGVLWTAQAHGLQEKVLALAFSRHIVAPGSSSGK